MPNVPFRLHVLNTSVFRLVILRVLTMQAKYALPTTCIKHLIRVIWNRLNIYTIPSISNISQILITSYF